MVISGPNLQMKTQLKKSIEEVKRKFATVDQWSTQSNRYRVRPTSYWIRLSKCGLRGYEANEIFFFVKICIFVHVAHFLRTRMCVQQRLAPESSAPGTSTSRTRTRVRPFWVIQNLGLTLVVAFTSAQTIFQLLRPETSFSLR